MTSRLLLGGLGSGDAGDVAQKPALGKSQPRKTKTGPSTNRPTREQKDSSGWLTEQNQKTEPRPCGRSPGVDCWKAERRVRRPTARLSPALATTITSGRTTAATSRHGACIGSSRLNEGGKNRFTPPPPRPAGCADLLVLAYSN